MPEWIFYDGTCGFCHRWIRLVLAIDKDGAAFRFSPHTGETFRARIPEETRAILPPGVHAAKPSFPSTERATFREDMNDANRFSLAVSQMVVRRLMLDPLTGKGERQA